ncbi:uncharacterized protein LTR77_000095 [Saxophila tyrrhenica]|uniref:Alpha/beta hydrolase fold-3 domain-containing protein n=1 Tax=Saxophila tyrrhenica TaxID=1690608 RepID=A0AAV9PM17_9PEZI|nr:hypothetical protein LTR77_000095 [Saxophila tyrrhenica]
MIPATPLPADVAVAPKFAAFDVVDINYKEVNGVQIPASVLVPKNIKPGKHPLLVRWHGGCLIAGHRMYPDWFPTWIIDLAASRDAIIITPDYRLMPEITGLEILDDVRDFYTWLFQPQALASYLPEGVSVDTTNILVTGESAGGWLALQSALLPTSAPKVAAVIAQYPMIDMRDRWYTEDYEKQIFSPPAPQLDRAVLQEYLKTMEKGKTITSAVPPERTQLVLSSLQQGMYGSWLGEDRKLYPIEALEGVERLPPVWVLHGKGDTIIPAEGSYRFEKAVREQVKGVELHVTYVEGDHGFDGAEGIGLETDWVREGVEFVGRYWPQQ